MKKAIILMLIAAATLAGCVERELTVRSTPPGAMVYLDEQPMGYTPLTFKFYFYGWRTFTLKKDGFQIYQQVRHVKPPWWQWPVIDIFTDLQPFPLKHSQEFDFTLDPIVDVPREQILERGQAMKARVDAEVPLPAPAAPEETQPQSPPEEAPAE